MPVKPHGEATENRIYHAIEGEIEIPFEEVVHQSILGTEDFVEWVRQKLPRKGQREVPSLKKLQHHISVERIIGEVAIAGNAQADDLRDRKTKLKSSRKLKKQFHRILEQIDKLSNSKI
jgi:hypothetical protein